MRSFKPISIIDGYIIKKFLGTFIFSILLIISIAVVFDINERLDKFLSNDAPLKAIIFDYYMNFIPFYANTFSALFVFISVIFFTSKLADNSEVIAMLSNGMSFNRLMKPYMISAAVIAAATFILGSFVIPPANETRIAFQNKYFRDKSAVSVNQVHVQVGKSDILYLQNYSKRNGWGRNIAIDSFDGKKLKSRVTAETAEYISDFNWKLKNYSIRRFIDEKEVMVSGAELDTVIAVTPADLLVSINDFEIMTTPELHTYINKQKERGLASVGEVSLTNFEIEYHKRFANIFSAFILTIIGASLSSRKIKGGMGLNIGIGLGLSFGYIVFMTVSSSFAISGTMSPFMAVWLPNFVYVFIAGFLYTKAPN